VPAVLRGTLIIIVLVIFFIAKVVLVPLALFVLIVHKVDVSLLCRCTTLSHGTLHLRILLSFVAVGFLGGALN
jgi:hypothetical protein